MLGLVFARSDGGRGSRFQVVGDKFIDFVFDQLAVDNPGFFNQHVAIGGQLRGFQEYVPG